jgi:Zn-dependent M16 (insulinase) family peptidase
MKLNRLLATIVLLGLCLRTVAQDYNSLKPQETVDGFKVVNVYLSGSGHRMGARLIHVKTGFTLDLLQIESVPQAFIYANTFPVSDRGEPHTQEHLLITKGNKGHDLNTREGLSMAVSNAFTAQLHTAYDFYTAAGVDVFYNLFGSYMDALLYPDYTNEEVKREVRNWGVSEAPDKALSIKEKGSVYNEMSTTMNDPGAILYDRMGRLLYGNAHPSSYNAGGLPAGIRELTPANIAAYHDANYYLGNMGAIVALPGSMKLESVLNKMDAIFNKLNGKDQHRHTPNLTLPPPQPAESGKIVALNVPTTNVHQPGLMAFAYPASLKIGLSDYIELSNFMSAFAGDATTNLYKLFVDSKTRIPGFSAQGVSSYVDNGFGHPVFIMFDGVAPENLDNEKAMLVRKTIADEFKKIASYKDHSPELLAFNKRYLSLLASTIKSYNKFVDSPPQFGYRNTGDAWYDQLNMLKKEAGFEKSITYKPQTAAIAARLKSGLNIWRTDFLKWNLTTANPYVLYTKADSALIAQNEAAQKARARAEVDRLKALYKLDNDQQTIARYKAVYDSNTMVLEKLEQAHNIKFIDNPPLTLDDQLIYKQSQLLDRVPVVASVFNNMTSATTGIGLNLHGVPENQLVYLAMLPELLTETGIIKNGKAIPYEEMIQWLQTEILSLDSYYSTNGVTGRAELTVKAAGSNEQEALRSIEWMSDVLNHPNWTPANLPRIRDLVEQELTSIRKKMQQPEEYWVSDPSNAYLYQDNELLLSTSSFLTRAFNIFRLKWMLKDGGSAADSTAISNYLMKIANTSGGRQQLLQSVTAIKISPAADALLKDAADDLTQMLTGVPDTSLTTDWKMLCLTMRHDLAQTPAKTLADLDQLRKSLLKTDNARVFMIGSAATEAKISAQLTQLLNGFDQQPASHQNYATHRLIDDRVKARMHTTENPVFIGLINPDSPTGVFINSAPLVSIRDTDKQHLLEYLAAALYGGAGKQSVYTKSTGAGLSYSTGVGENPYSGRFSYYAERTPELPQTLKFVIHEVKNAPVDSNVSDYVIASAFRSNAGSAYESRGEAMAGWLTDGQTPDLVRNFRSGILKLRKDKQLVSEIYGYKQMAYEKILPGYGIPSKDVKGGVFFVIGPEKQMQLYEGYLKSVDGKEAQLYRLYPRDYWMPEF